MKRILWAVFFVLVIPSLIFADEVDKGLPSDTSLRIKESTRQVIQTGIETDTVIKMTRSMISDHFSEQQIVTGLELLIKARKQNVSEEPIISKLHEGIAKNVGAENILQAMEKVRTRYELANTYTQNMRTDDDHARIMTKEMAECMAAGMDKSSMTKIMEMLQSKTRNTTKNEAIELNQKTLNMARTMARSGVDSKVIVDVMSSALQRNYNAGEIEKLGSAFMTQSKGMSSASDLARSYSTAIKNGATPDNIGRFSAPPPGSGAAGGAPPPPNGGIAGGAPPPNGNPNGTPPPNGGLRPAAGGNPGAPAPPSAGASHGAPPGAPPGAPRK
jgi:hypothetical protein